MNGLASPSVQLKSIYGLRRIPEENEWEKNFKCQCKGKARLMQKRTFFFHEREKSETMPKSKVYRLFDPKRSRVDAKIFSFEWFTYAFKFHFNHIPIDSHRASKADVRSENGKKHPKTTRLWYAYALCSCAIDHNFERIKYYYTHSYNTCIWGEVGALGCKAVGSVCILLLLLRRFVRSQVSQVAAKRAICARKYAGCEWDGVFGWCLTGNGWGVSKRQTRRRKKKMWK